MESVVSVRRDDLGAIEGLGRLIIFPSAGRERKFPTISLPMHNHPALPLTLAFGRWLTHRIKFDVLRGKDNRPLLKMKLVLAKEIN